MIAAGMIRVALAGAVALCVALLWGCAGGAPVSSTPVQRGVAPTYAAVAAAYNERVAHLDQIWARSVVRLAYRDADGDLHNEQGEGLMQVVRPDRFAMSIKKAGKMLFWLGCDGERYWWIDVFQDKAARVGRHGGPGAGESGVMVSPLDVVSLLGIVPLDSNAPGATQWSDDGLLLGVTVERRQSGAAQDGRPRGRERLWLDPESYQPRKIELYDHDGGLEVVADLGEYSPVEMVGYGGARPRIAMMIDAYHPASRTRLRLDLAGMRNAGVVPGAFDIDLLVSELGIERVIDLDKEAGGRSGTK